MASAVLVAREFESLKGEFRFGFSKLKDKQTNVIANIVNKRDCMGIFPTGYGKSACYILPPLILKNMHQKEYFSIVVSPLRSLMDDQVRQLSAMGIKAVIAGPDSSAEEKKGLEDGSYRVVFFSPQILDNIDRWRFFLEANIYTDAVAVLAIDEAHLLQSWGEEFRPAFRRIVELWGFFPSVSVLLLSATCTNTVRQSLIQKLQLAPDIAVEWEVPDRPNIHLEVRSESGMDTLLRSGTLMRL